MEKFDSRYAVTFGQMYYTHDGLDGQEQRKQYSFSVSDLLKIQQRLANHEPPIKSQIYHLESSLPEVLRKQNEAAVLLIPDMANIMLESPQGADNLYNQQKQTEYDKKYYDKTMKKTCNRKARYHMIFGDNQRPASQDFQEHTITSFNKLHHLSEFRCKLGNYFQINQNMNKEYLQRYYAEGVHYYEEGSGLGFHGDDGRLVVVGLCLGREATLRYCWRKPNSSDNGAYPCIDLKVRHGDVYIMSKKATGNDWKKRSQYRVLHAAGATKYIGI